MEKKFLELIMNLQNNTEQPILKIIPWRNGVSETEFEFMKHLKEEISFYCFEDTEVHILLFKKVTINNEASVIVKIKSFNNKTGESKILGELTL